ncbi:cupredoxin domain-containing protein [Aeromonas intestinalis]
MMSIMLYVAMMLIRIISGYIFHPILIIDFARGMHMAVKMIATVFMLMTWGATASEKDHQVHAHQGENAQSEHVAVGSPGMAGDVSRTLNIAMNDTMRFTPDVIAVKQGETVRFSIKNDGKVAHELVLGSPAELKAHAGMMQQQGMEMEHDMPNMISLAPGKESDMVWKFDQAGTVSFACLIPGHMEAGMVGEIVVQ